MFLREHSNFEALVHFDVLCRGEQPLYNIHIITSEKNDSFNSWSNKYIASRT